MTSASSTIRALSLSCLGAVLALGVSGLLPSHEAEARRPGRMAQCQQDLANYQAAYQELIVGLDRIERINAKGQKDRKRIRRAVRQARKRASRYVVIDQAPPAPPATVPAPPPPPPAPGYEPAPDPGPQIISRRAFKRLLRSVKGKSFPKERLAAIREAAKYNSFTVRQVVRLIGACTFESTKVDVAVMLHPYVVDVENWFEVYDAFTFPSSRKKVQRRLRR